MNFSFSPEQGKLQFLSHGGGSFSIPQAHFAFKYSIDGKSLVESSTNLHFTLEIHEKINDDVFGPSIHEQYQADSTLAKVHFKVEFLQPEQGDVVLWRLRLSNKNEQVCRIHQFDLLNPEGEITHAAGDQLRFFSQGWQSWAHTASYGIQDRMISSNLSVAQEPLCYDHGTPRYRQRGKFSSDFFGVLADRQSKTGMLVGFISQREQFGAVSIDLHDTSSMRLWAKGDDVILPAGESMQTDWALLQFLAPSNHPIDQYACWVGAYHGMKQAPETHAGWCSWYYFYQNISEKIIQDNLEQIDRLQPDVPLHLVQIDDGYEKQVGDWLKFTPLFPDGVAPLAAGKGLMPGLWMAPFIVHPKADLMTEHPEWILRKPNGKPVNAGFIWNVFTTALDLTQPEAMEYAARVVKVAAEEWGFPYLKLDFLYAAALPGVHQDQTKTRAQILRYGYEKIREAVGPDVYLLGCGAPMGTSIGFFEAMRIGADVSGSWVPKYFNLEWPFRGEPNMPSARNAIQNVLTRQYMHGNWWVNDPDCLLVRPDSELTLDEVKTLTSVIGLSGGAFLVSDDMPALPADRINMIQKVMPIHHFPVDVPDLLYRTVPEQVLVHCQNGVETWQVLGLYNWQDVPREATISLKDLGIEEGRYWVRSFWDDRIYQVDHTQTLPLTLASHGCAVLSIRSASPDKALYLGSNLHVLQGLELEELKDSKNSVEMELALTQQMQGWVDVYIPKPAKVIVVNGNETQWQTPQENVLRIPVAGTGKIKIEIKL